MLGNYILIGAKIKFKNPVTRLQENVKKYESSISLLEKKYDNDATIKESLQNIQIAWRPIKEKLLSVTMESNRETMRKDAQLLHTNLNNIIIKMEDIKKYLLKSITSINIIELNSAIEISISAQHLSAHYMMQMWELPDPSIIKHWDSAITKYKKGIVILKKSSYYKNPEFKEWLDKTDRILEYAIISFSMIDENSIPSMIQNKCETAYEMGNKMALKIVSTKL